MPRRKRSLTSLDTFRPIDGDDSSVPSPAPAAERDQPGQPWPPGGTGRRQPPPPELLDFLVDLGVDVAALLPGAADGTATNTDLVTAMLQHADRLTRTAELLRALGVAWGREFVTPDPVSWPALATAAARSASTLKDIAPTPEETAAVEELTHRPSRAHRAELDIRLPAAGKTEHAPLTLGILGDYAARPLIFDADSSSASAGFPADPVAGSGTGAPAEQPAGEPGAGPRAAVADSAPSPSPAASPTDGPA
ncbi:hypothetical protein [Actinomadura violacea]|uniref:Uncharacterized protein n=1 Tax=Actinomadura violacea TaxID=2819934 RepID=A0ABS3RXI5_9ACTN|nr:hypothetical protein [Actinomadura violacea]MBO2461460.1 hypothetical protein [Actinomadura violacea]